MYQPSSSGLGCVRLVASPLQYSVSVMEMEYADLLLQLQRVGSEGYVENAAREEYGFIKQGEIVFAFENPDALKGYTEEEYQIIMDEMRD